MSHARFARSRNSVVGALRAIRYPIDALELDTYGRVGVSVPIVRIRRALDDKYVYLTRSELARILYERARRTGLAIARLPSC